jgi:hypothetical protein
MKKEIEKLLLRAEQEKSKAELLFRKINSIDNGNGIDYYTGRISAFDFLIRRLKKILNENAVPSSETE